jgi:hypothetical protein
MVAGASSVLARDQSMPHTPLGLHEIHEYTRAHPNLKDRAYRVDFRGTAFGLLYVTPIAYTLAWDGAVSFANLEKEVSKVLETVWAPSVNLRDTNWRERTSVALVFPTSTDSDELVKYRLSEPDQHVKYVEAMKNPSGISFARYDFSDNTRSAPFFSFIAQNAALVPPGSDNELALKLSKSMTEALLRWVVAHHRESAQLTQEVEIAASVSNLNERV